MPSDRWGWEGVYSDAGGQAPFCRKPGLAYISARSLRPSNSSSRLDALSLSLLLCPFCAPPPPPTFKKAPTPMGA